MGKKGRAFRFLAGVISEVLVELGRQRVEKSWDAELEWAPTLYDGIETASLPSDDDGLFFIAHWSEGIFRWVTAYGDTREEAVRDLIEMAPDVMRMLHREADDLQQDVYRLEREQEEQEGG